MHVIFILKNNSMIFFKSKVLSIYLKFYRFILIGRLIFHRYGECQGGFRGVITVILRSGHIIHYYLYSCLYAAAKSGSRRDMMCML